MCQPACRGGNKRSRNTSNPTLICPYRSTMVSPSNLSAASKAPSSPGESRFSRAVLVFFHRACVGTRQFRVNTLNWTSRTCDLYFFLARFSAGLWWWKWHFSGKQKKNLILTIPPVFSSSLNSGFKGEFKPTFIYIYIFNTLKLLLSILFKLYYKR